MKTLKSFKYAGAGILHGLQEHNMRLHVIAAIAVIILGAVFSITLFEWALLFIAIGLVITAELCNTAIEEVCDIVTEAYPKSYEKAGTPKDVAAGAVLVASIISLIIGILIFVPYINAVLQL